MAITPGTSGERDGAPARLTSTPPGAPAPVASEDDALRLLGGNLIGSVGSGFDEVHGVEPGDGSLCDHLPIGSAFAGLHPEVQGNVPAAITGLEAGMGTLATGAGERAAAGRGAGTRSSRADQNASHAGRDGFE